MKTSIGSMLLLCSLSFSPLYADLGKDLGEQSSPDSVYKVVGKVVEPQIFAKKPASFEFVIQKEVEQIVDATVSMTCYLNVQGYVCATDTDVQVEKAGKCPKCNTDLQQGMIRKKVKPESKVPCPKYDYVCKQVFDLVGDYEVDLKVEIQEAAAFTVTFRFTAEQWVAPKKHTCATCGGTYPGPGHCKKCGQTLVEKGTEPPKTDEPKHKKKH